MPYPEPTHEMSTRSTISSSAEGRLKVDAGGRKKRRQYLKKKLHKCK